MYFLFDIGGTRMRLGVSDNKKLLKVVSCETPRRFRDGMQLLEKEGRKLLQDEKPEIVSGGIAGVIDQKFGICKYSPNLKGWVGKPLVSELNKVFRCPVLLENDAALAGLGETWFGAGKGRSVVGYLTISTGVGGGRIVDGNIDRKTFGFEPGHQILDFKNNKTLEDLVSGETFQKKYRKHPSMITNSKIWDEAAKILAGGLHNIIVLWSPEIIVLGGSMVLKKPGIDVERVKFYLRRVSKAFPKLPEVRRAKLGGLSGLYGALIYADEYADKLR